MPCAVRNPGSGLMACDSPGPVATLTDVMDTDHPWPEPLRRMPDGTVKQINPYSGTSVWTVPGRGNRPIDLAPDRVAAVDPGAPEAHCAFCVTRLRETTPEKSRLVRDGDGWTVLDEVPADDLDATTPEFRLFGNLFEIVSLDYWKAVHGYRISERAAAHQVAYLASAAGAEHVRALVRARIAAAQGDPAAVDSMVPCHCLSLRGNNAVVLQAQVRSPITLAAVAAMRCRLANALGFCACCAMKVAVSLTKIKAIRASTSGRHQHRRASISISTIRLHQHHCATLQRQRHGLWQGRPRVAVAFVRSQTIQPK